MKRTLFILAIASLPACAGGPTFSPAADREIGRFSSRTARLMELAEDPYGDHAKATEKLLADLRDAQDRAGRRQANDVAAAQWDLLLASDGNLVGGFFLRWETEGSLRPGFIVEAIALVEEAFDRLRAHERRKTGAPR